MQAIEQELSAQNGEECEKRMKEDICHEEMTLTNYSIQKNYCEVHFEKMNYLLLRLQESKLKDDTPPHHRGTKR